MTSQAQREKILEVANAIAGLQGIQGAVVDDDDGHGSFNLFIRLRNRWEERFGSRRIDFAIPLYGLMPRITRIILRHGARLEWHEPPRRKYSQPGHGKKLFEGYDGDSYKLSVYVPQPMAGDQRPQVAQLTFA